MTDTAIGTRVWVESIDGKDLGEGTYQGEVLLADAANEEAQVPIPAGGAMTQEESAVFGAAIEQYVEEGGTTPKIKLDTGEVVYGFQCYWGEL